MVCIVSLRSGLASSHRQGRVRQPRRVFEGLFLGYRFSLYLQLLLIILLRSPTNCGWHCSLWMCGGSSLQRSRWAWQEVGIPTFWRTWCSHRLLRFSLPLALARPFGMSQMPHVMSPQAPSTNSGGRALDGESINFVKPVFHVLQAHRVPPPILTGFLYVLLCFLYAHGHPPPILAGGFEARSLKDAGLDATPSRQDGFDARFLSQAGLHAVSTNEAGLSWNDAGFDAGSMELTAFDARSMQ